MRKQELNVVQETSHRESSAGAANDAALKGGEDRAGRLVALGRALSDPIRVRMLGMMARGRGCCSLPDCGVPAEDQDIGICVCEFEAVFGMGQSKVSYHLGKLKDAALVREEKRGRWSFYSLKREAAEGLLSEVADWLLPQGAGEGHGGTEERAS